VTRNHVLRLVAPVALAIVLLGAWQLAVTLYDVPAYLVPSPLRIGQAMWEDRALLAGSLWVTVKIALTALAIAVAAGDAVARVAAGQRSPTA
jgi:NitT/TauT family transport system permease protein